MMEFLDSTFEIIGYDEGWNTLKINEAESGYYAKSIAEDMADEGTYAHIVIRKILDEEYIPDKEIL